MKIEELKQQLATKVAEARSLNDQNKGEEAEKVMTEIRKLQDEIAKEERQLELDKIALEERANNNNDAKGDDVMETRKLGKEVEYRACAKVIMGQELSEDEKRAYKQLEEKRDLTNGNYNSNTGAILPEEFINKIQIIKDGYKDLTRYCDVIPVISNHGKMPTALNDDEFANLEEDTEMVQGMLDTKEIDYSVADYGLLKAVHNDVLKDGAVNFMDGILAPALAKGSINKRNSKIVSVVEANATNVTIKDGETVEDVLEKAILKTDRALRDGLVILCNLEGQAYLSALKGNDKASADVRVTFKENDTFFKGKEVIEVKDKYLPTLGTGKSMVFYLVNLRELVKFFERQGYEISKSMEAGFTLNKTLVKAIERYDVKVNPYTVLKAKKFVC